MFGNEKGVGGPLLAVDVQPHSAAELQLDQRREFRWTLFHGAQLLAADAGQVNDGYGPGGGSRGDGAGLQTAQPERRPGPLLRSVVAEHEQLRRQRPHLWDDALPQALGIRPEHGTRGDLIAGGIGLRG